MFEKWEQMKAELAVRLQWIGWGSVLILALLFFFFNWEPVTLNVVFGTFKTSGALVFAAIFFIGWSLGKIYRYTATKVNAIQEKYRERMAVLHKTNAMAAAAAVTSPMSAPAPTVPLYAQTASGGTAPMAADPPKPVDAPAEATKAPEQAG